MKKIAVITGASSGMGYQFALQIDKNYKTIDEVWLIARRRERLEELSREMDKPCVIISEDINDKTFPDTLLKMLKEYELLNSGKECSEDSKAQSLDPDLSDDNE